MSSGLTVQTTAHHHHTTAPPLNARVPRVKTPQTYGQQAAHTKGEETLIVLKNQVAALARDNERKQALRAMKQVPYLQVVVLDPPAPSSIPQDLRFGHVEREVLNGCFQLNGIVMGSGQNENKQGGGETSTMTRSAAEARRILQQLCAHMAAQNGTVSGTNNNLTKNTLYHSLILRLGGITSRTDSYRKLAATLASRECAIFPVVPEATTAAAATNKMQQQQQQQQQHHALPLNQVTIYESGGAIHATFKMYYPYGLYRAGTNPDNAPRPWIRMTAVVQERCNLSTGVSTRLMELILPRK